MRIFIVERSICILLSFETCVFGELRQFFYPEVPDEGGEQEDKARVDGVQP